jgi:hypothetical protein
MVGKQECQNLMILARFGGLRTRLDLGALPPLILRCSSGLSRRPPKVKESIFWRLLGPICFIFLTGPQAGNIIAQYQSLVGGCMHRSHWFTGN